MTKPIMGLLYGDAAGVGPEVVTKALANREISSMAKWLLIGDERVFLNGANITGNELSYKKISDTSEMDIEADDIWLLDTQNTDPAHVQIGELSAETGKAAGDNLMTALELAKKGIIEGLTYGPMNKSGLYKGGFKFKDDIHLVASSFELESGFSEVNLVYSCYFTYSIKRSS